MESPGICGCDVDDGADADADGTPDCVDLCADAPDRLDDGECGCEAAAGDDDDDGIANCNDACPSDPAKQLPGVCGCGESDVDSDADGMPDCADLCADDPDKLQPGDCDCGSPDVDSDGDIDGIVEAAVSRLRPVAMAAITTVLGMIPLLADAFFVAMAVTIMAGLSFATLLTMILVPVLYATFFGVESESFGVELES